MNVKELQEKKKVNAFKDGYLILSQMIKLFFEKNERINSKL